jgi:hypothetical protein
MNKPIDGIASDEVFTSEKLAVPSISELPFDAPGWAKDLNDNIATLFDAVHNIGVTVHETNEAMLNIADIAENVKGEVQPLIQRLESHPMLKMLLGGKK